MDNVVQNRDSSNRQQSTTCFYDSEKKTFLGRNCVGWGRLGLFYLIFFAALTALIAICTTALLATLDPKEPKYKLEDSLIGKNPGLGLRPVYVPDGFLISYDLKKPSSAQKWVELLDEFLKPYQEINPENYENCTYETTPETVCMVDNNFGPCTSQHKYGYDSPSPCVFIKLNKIWGWVPEFYNESTDDLPDDLSDFINNLTSSERNQIWISCNGEEESDKKNIAGFNYYPSRGFPGYFYPFVNAENHLSPLIAVEILNLKPNVVINIECRAWAENIYYKGGKQDRQGSVHFEILVKDNN